MKRIIERALGELTPAEEEKYNKLVQQIHDDLNILVTAWARVARRLRTIRDERLYRKVYPTFEAFCEKELNRGRDYIYKLIAANDVRDQLIADGVTRKELPDNPRVARELSYFDRSLHAKIMRQAIEIALFEGRAKPDSRDIRNAAAELSPEGKARQIKALLEKFRGIERGLPESITWDKLEAHQRAELIGIMLEISARLQGLVRQAKGVSAASLS